MEFTYTESLKNEVPKEIRLEVYKRAKNLIENWEKGTFGLINPQLCLILPCILYNQENYLDSENDWNNWCPHGTVLGFTEFTDYDIEEILISSDINAKRLELLTQWIEQLEK